MSERHLPEPILRRLAASGEVEIETSAGPRRPAHRAVIWVVVDELGRVLVRSYLGRTARWFREATINPEGALWVDGERIAARFEPAGDPERIAALDAGYRAKYPPGRSLDAMLDPRLADTTLEVVPREPVAD